jgi:hypothetical protein
MGKPQPPICPHAGNITPKGPVIITLCNNIPPKYLGDYNICSWCLMKDTRVYSSSTNLPLFCNKDAQHK